METFRAYTTKDMFGRLNIVSSTQIPFHVRRIISNALDIPKSQVRVIKPRIGGGYGATQGIFAIESIIDELAEKLGMNPIELREKNMVREGDFMPAYYGETANSCALDRCLARAKEMIDWDNKYPCRDMGNGKVRGVGLGFSIQGSSITSIDIGSVAIKVGDDGFYNLMVGATDMGTGCDNCIGSDSC